MKVLFLASSPLFTACKNLPPFSRYVFRREARFRQNWPKIGVFPILCNIKNRPQKGVKWHFLTHFRPLNLPKHVFTCISMEQTRFYSKIAHILPISEFFKGFIAEIAQKSGPATFKLRYLKNTFFPKAFALEELWSWKLATMGPYRGQKIA